MNGGRVMKDNRLFTLLLLLATGGSGVWAQQDEATVGRTEWTLAECIDHAVEHNISIRQSENRRIQQDLQLNTDRWSRLPSVEASAGQNMSFGRGLTDNNTYTNTNTSSTSFSLGASVPLFTGLRITNAIKLDRLSLDAATADLEKARNDVRVQVAQAYVQALYDMEIVGVACRQVVIDSLQTVRLRAMKEHGKASEAELSQQEATLAQSRLTATQADGNRRLSLLALSQLLELQSAEGFAIAVPDTAAVAVSGYVVPSPDAVFENAVGIMPEVRAERLRLQGAGYSVKVAQAALYPQLSLSAGLGTNYYHTSGYKSASFASQMRNNFSQYVGLNLSVPLFNRFQTRNSVRSARIEQQTQALQLENVKKSLYKEIQTVCQNAVNARSKFESCRLALKSGEDAFVLMQAKYENGKATATEFNEAKNSMMKAQSDLAQARYECLYQMALVSFYRGRGLHL